MLTISDAHFDFGRERILRGASFTAYAGQKCALVGPNGAGKTTLLNILAGEIALQGGSRSLIGGTQLRYLRQETTLEAPAGGAGTVLEAVADAAFARERELEREIHDVAARLAAPHDEQAQHPRPTRDACCACVAARRIAGYPRCMRRVSPQPPRRIGGGTRGGVPCRLIEAKGTGPWLVIGRVHAKGRHGHHAGRDRRPGGDRGRLIDSRLKRPSSEPRRLDVLASSVVVLNRRLSAAGTS
jgi:energy-coupling factor transporter ATP-binding protein EcfA2